jgi:hypothetical protein
MPPEPPPKYSYPLHRAADTNPSLAAEKQP